MSISFHNIDTYYMITNVEDHKEKKAELIDLIDKCQYTHIEEEGQCHKSDWYIGKEVERGYWNVFLSMITPYMYQITNIMHMEKWHIENAWFQIYNTNDYHNWHVHPIGCWANVYYLKLPDKTCKTQFYDERNDKIIDNIEVQEGQMLSMPCNFHHRSPINKSKETKIVIAFNSYFSKN